MADNDPLRFAWAQFQLCNLAKLKHRMVVTSHVWPTFISTSRVRLQLWKKASSSLVNLPIASGCRHYPLLMHQQLLMNPDSPPGWCCLPRIWKTYHLMHASFHCRVTIVTILSPPPPPSFFLNMIFYHRRNPNDLKGSSLPVRKMH